MSWKAYFSFHQKKAVASIILAVIMFVGIACYTIQEPEYLIYMPIILISMALFVLLGTFKLPAEGRLTKTAAVLWYPVAVLFVLLPIQTMLGAQLWLINPWRLFLNMVCVSLVASLFLILTARVRLSLYLAAFVLFLLVAADYLVILFRGTSLIPSDFFSAGAAITVLPNYKLAINAACFLSLVYWGALPLLNATVPAHKFIRKGRVRLVAAGAVVVFALVWYFGCSPLVISGFVTNSARQHGFLASFSAQLFDMFKDKMPEGYSLERIAALEEKYRNPDGAAQETSGEEPDVIVIMNESFSDLSVLGSELNTDPEILPYFNSLKENTIRAQALVSVYGGGTVHSEYSFLTGNIQESLSQRKSMYTMYVKNPTYSLATEFKLRGYTTHATHPLNPGGYDRYRVYPLLGFEEANFIDDYPRQNLIREYVSDQEMYEFIAEKYANKAEGEKFFLFGVSMQNHGGYDYDGKNYTPTIALDLKSKEKALAEQYLGVLHESDKALEYLIDYFQNVDHKVVIVFFGDHQPNIGEKTTAELHGGSFKSLEDNQVQYIVPFLIWTNYDIEEQELGLKNLPFLSTYLYDAAGLEPSPYSRFLRDMSEVIPAMNDMGYYSPSKDRFITYDKAEGEEAEWLRDYEFLQYNSLFDVENRSEVFFPHLEDAQN